MVIRKKIVKQLNIFLFNKALSCVGQDDLVTLRIVCTMAQNKRNKLSLEDVDDYGNTPLLKACYLGRSDCARTLLHFGANIFAVNYFGQNALTLATCAGNLPLVQELLCRRSYKDFNRSSLIPALCVAVMKKHADLEKYFIGLDPVGVHTTQTVHGGLFHLICTFSNLFYFTLQDWELAT